MDRNALETFADELTQAWGPLDSGLVDACRRHMEKLLQAPATEAWLAALLHDGPASRELIRSPEHGFVLLAHTEAAGLYRPPHDHGRAWVAYGVVRGESEMGSYVRIAGAHGRARLVKRNATLVKPGQVRVYLPGDIHDTRCVSGPALLFRFTERDLKKEDADEHRVTRYEERDGDWVPGAR